MFFDDWFGVFRVVVMGGTAYVALIAILRFSGKRTLARSSATLLLQDGAIDRAALRRERVTREEVRCAVRSAGLGDIADVAAVVLETGGSFNVVAQQRAGNRAAFPPHPRGGAS